jgi:hypothetical protein
MVFDFRHGRIARGVLALPKVSPQSAMPYPSKPCGRATPEILTAISGMARPQSGRPEAVFYPFGHPTLYAHDFRLETSKYF